jgi:error-prone DNA polymerase
MTYAELHCISNFSFLRGASHPEELVARAKEEGYAALAITDECSLAGVVRAHIEAKKCALKLVIGSEFRLDDGLRLVLLATDRESYGNLAALITRGRRSAVKGSYRLSRADLADGIAGCLALWLPGRVPDADKALAPRLRGAVDRRRAPARGRRRWRVAPSSPKSRRRPGCRSLPPATSTCMGAIAAPCRTR